MLTLCRVRACAICRQSVAIMLVAVAKPVARRNSARISLPEKPVLGAARVLGISQRPHQVLAQVDSLGQGPGPVRVDGDPGVWESGLECLNGFDLLGAGQHAALELEVLEPVERVGGFGLPDDGFRGKCLFMPDPVPVDG